VKYLFQVSRVVLRLKLANKLWIIFILQFVHKWRFYCFKKTILKYHPTRTPQNILLILIVELLLSLFREIVYKQPSLKALNPLARQPLLLNFFFSSKFSSCEALHSAFEEGPGSQYIRVLLQYVFYLFFESWNCWIFTVVSLSKYIQFD